MVGVWRSGSLDRTPGYAATMSDLRNEVIEAIRFASVEELIAGLAERGVKTRPLKGDRLKLSLEVKLPGVAGERRRPAPQPRVNPRFLV